ncbi:MAG: hypothetical protein HYX87_08275 [Chloroflexi bacterium]|nr:hypothetical protein [Chloroflexota bacterium]
MNEEQPISYDIGEPAKSWDNISLDQLKLYATECAALYRKERQLREQLEAKNKDLELRNQELSALNAMFQRNLELRKLAEDSLRKTVEAISKVSDDARQLLQAVDVSRSNDAGR